MADAEDTAPLIVPGLERLAQLDTIKLKQLTSSYKNNNFTVLDGEDVLINLVEEDHEFDIFSFGRRRGFHSNIVDNTGKKVYTLRRPGTSIKDKIQIRQGDDLVATARCKMTLLKPVYRIFDAQGNLVLRLKGSTCDYDNFVLQTKLRKTIGGIKRKSFTTTAQVFARLDDYTISFPADLELNMKVAVIVGCVLMDFRLHEFRAAN
ncbi:hypothetical protein PYW07_006809 [Mythimna separata]|uniref:Phospholipid scramblase n=1 Tax=Mythimna separata TaxID=271217 RepID=A0AAD8DZE7_MYTSE|nr:hypothetical protein PYW07_006809 [Mythimna separata]